MGKHSHLSTARPPTVQCAAHCHFSFFFLVVSVYVDMVLVLMVVSCSLFVRRSSMRHPSLSQYLRRWWILWRWRRKPSAQSIHVCGEMLSWSWSGEAYSTSSLSMRMWPQVPMAMLGSDFVGPISEQDKKLFERNQKLRYRTINALLGGKQPIPSHLRRQR